jgi:hypothetical protein
MVDSIKVTEPVRAQESISSANRQLLENLLKEGDRHGRGFRRLCYRAAADTLNRYVLDQGMLLSTPQRQQLRQSLSQAIDDTEKTFSALAADGEPSSVKTSLGASTWNDFDRFADENRGADEEKPTPSEASRRNVRSNIFPLLLGASATFLVALALHLGGVLYVYARPDNVEDFRAFSEAVRQAQPLVGKSLDAVRLVEQRLKESMKDGSLENNPELRKGMMPLAKIFPDLASEVKNSLPPASSVVLRVIDRPTPGYKILINSEYCSAASTLDPAKVDPRRSSNPLFCRYYGVWTDNARGL